MTTITRPPPILKTRQDNKPYFTLHKQPNSIMAWPTTTTKMAVVAFSRPSDILSIGSLIECHYKHTMNWPDFNTMTFTTGPIKNQALEILDIAEWSNFEELKVFCVEHFFDLIVVDKVSESFKIKGAIYTLDIPMTAYLPQLERVLYN